jgi:phage terminase large subunit
MDLQSPAAIKRAAQNVVAQHARARSGPLVVWAGVDEPAARFAARAAKIKRHWDGRVLAVTSYGMTTPDDVEPVMLPVKAFCALHPSRRARYRVLRGGRGAAKSWSIARALILTALSHGVRVLCCREIQRSIRESTHRLLAEQIDALGLGQYFEVGMQTIVGYNASEFIFEGLWSNTSKLKSIEGIDICWVEEAAGVSADSWQTLTPTVRKAGSEIWVNYNPIDATDPTHQMFAVSPPPDAIVDHLDWRDNPYFPVELTREREYLLRVDPDAHAHVYGGECRLISNAAVLAGKWGIEAFDPGADWGDALFGVDYGYSQDPSTMVKLWVHERVLYLEYEAYAVGCDIDRLPQLFDRVPGARNAIIRADNARPETTSYLVAHGYPGMRSCEKWSGSVEDGVAHLRSYERIVIHPRCEHATQEARLWSYKTDRLSHEVTPQLLDRHNHIWDAARYALQPVIKPGGPTAFLQYMGQQLTEQRTPKNPALATRPGAVVRDLDIFGHKL